MSVLFNDTVMWTNVTEFNRGSWCLRTLTFSLALLRSEIRASTFSCKTTQSSGQENLSRMPSGCFISTQPAIKCWYKLWRKVSFSWNKRKDYMLYLNSVRIEKCASHRQYTNYMQVKKSPHSSFSNLFQNSTVANIYSHTYWNKCNKTVFTKCVYSDIIYK